MQIPMLNAMIVGIDTYHDANTTANPSVTGFVASMNRDCTKFYSVTQEDERGQDVSSCLNMLTTNALRNYR